MNRWNRKGSTMKHPYRINRKHFRAAQSLGKITAKEVRLCNRGQPIPADLERDGRHGLAKCCHLAERWRERSFRRAALGNDSHPKAIANLRWFRIVPE
jgi:hypothetical protein